MEYIEDKILPEALNDYWLCR